jgi:hypothetical protein
MPESFYVVWRLGGGAPLPIEDAPRKTHKMICQSCGKGFYTSARSVRCVACADEHAVEGKRKRDARKYRREHATVQSAVG